MQALQRIMAFVQMCKMKGFIYYWDLILTFRMCGKNSCCLGWGESHIHMPPSGWTNWPIFPWTFIYQALHLPSQCYNYVFTTCPKSLVISLNAPGGRWLQWESGKGESAPGFSSLQRWSRGYCSATSQNFHCLFLLWSPLSQWRMPQDDCLFLF